MRGRRGAVIVAVVAVVGLAVTLHALEITSIQRVSHDDTISYLAATGHQGEYQQVVDSASAPVAQWVPASRWQAFTRIEDPLPLLTIARDLGHHDIHPPVYFWLLHMWMLLFGGSLWTGPMLNVVIHVLTAVVLWRLARHLAGSPLAAWGAVGIWATLPAVAQTAVSTRQYSLASLWSITLGWAFIRTREAPSVRGLLALGTVTALGMLTLYPFGLVVAGLGLVCLADLLLAARRRTALAQLGAFATGGIVFLLCQPWLRETLARQQDQVETFSPALMWLRVDAVLRDLPRFAIGDLPVQAGVAMLVVTALLALLAWRARPAARPLIWLAVWGPVMLSAAYVAVLTPGAASQARYFSIALPHVALLPVLAWPYLRIRPLPALAAAVFVAAAVANVALATRAADTPPAATLDAGRPVVIDNLARGVLLRILWDAPSATPVYAASQDTLLSTTDRWLRCAEPSPCHEQALTLATQVQYEATRSGQAQILDAASDVRDVIPEPALDDLAKRYRLSAPTTGAVARVRVGDGDIHAGGPSRTASTMITTSTTARSVAAAARASYGADHQNSRRRASHQNSVK
jgi:hypothetical protein